MSDKKIRFTVPNFVNEITFRDIENFDIKINSFFNRLFTSSYISVDKYPFKKSSGNKKIQFNLNKENQLIYDNLLPKNKIQNESEYFRDLIRTYISQPHYKRERKIFYSEYESIQKAIQRKEEVLITLLGNDYIVEPYFFKVTPEEKNNFLFCWIYEKKEYSVFNLSRISKVTPIRFRKNKRHMDIVYIDKVHKKFDPFLSYGNIVKVKLTDQGKIWFKRINHYKPTLIKIEGDIYYCESSDTKATLYFARFYNEAEILEPLSLRKKMKVLLENTISQYK